MEILIIVKISDNFIKQLYTAILLATMLATGIIVYSNSFHAEMVFDDHPFIIDDPSVHMTELSWDGIKTAAFKGFPAHRYLPNISWALNYYFGQLNPFGYHLVNLIIHLLSGIFLFFFIKNTLRIDPGHTRDAHPALIAFFAALIWIVQPVGTQSVTYICQRMASMVALFYILSLLLYVRGRMAMRQNPGRRLVPGLYFLGCALSAVCAIATKENAGTLPLVILLYEWFFFHDLKLNRSRRQMLWIAFFVIVFAGVVLWFLGENPMLRIINSYKSRDFSLTERVMTEWRIMVYYISLFLWAPPGRLNLDHDYPLSLSPLNPATTMLTLAAILGLLYLSAYSAKKDRLIAFCILWFFITQATESTIIGIELIFEHRTYIPFMMTSLLFVLAAFRLVKNRPIAYGLLVSAALVFSVWTYQRNQIWHDPVTFWTDAMEKSANKPRAAKNLAFAYQQKKNGRWLFSITKKH
jgi:protein O-mannosyl-transferase